MPVGGFTYRRAIEELCFLQAPLLSLQDFVKAADRRGLLFFSLVHRGTWETLDREELLPPVAFITGQWVHGFEGEAMRQGNLRLREERGFEDWGEAVPLYSRWQLLTASAITKLLQVSHPLDRVQAGIDALADWLRTMADSVAERRGYEEYIEGWRHEELLLTRTQSLLLPLITGRYRGPALVPELKGQDPFDWTRQQQREFSYRAAARECGVKAEELTDLYEHLVRTGQGIDPMERWFALTDQIQRRQLDELAGDGLLAWDYYDAARIIRGWHARLPGTNALPDINEFLHGTEETQRFQKRLFGEAEIRGNRAALPGILEHYGIYPWRVQLLVEGPSESAMLRVLIAAYGTSFERLGIHVISLGGAGIPKKTDQLLGAVRDYANYYLLVFDREGTAERLIDELRRAGHIETDPETQIWRDSLEADNFTIPEICREVRKMARERGVSGFTITTAEVRTRYESGKKGLAEVAIALARERNLVIKKQQLAGRLGALAVRKPELHGERRPIHELAEHLLRLSAADRRLKGKLRS